MHLPLVSSTDAHHRATLLSKGSQKQLKYNWCKLSCQDRLIAKIAQRLMIISVRMHRRADTAVQLPFSGYLYSIICPSLRE